ncbi:MAG: hypothetical protein LGB54_06945 [Sulfurovum sp.]|nr:hypothetical protein [Sulfurovum sp.]
MVSVEINQYFVCSHQGDIRPQKQQQQILPQLFQKNGYDLNACNDIRDILYNTDVITNIVKSSLHSPVEKFV